MRKTQNINLNLYDQSDTFNITGSQNSLNSNFEIIDEEINALNNTNSIDEVKNDVASLSEDMISKADKTSLVKTDRKLDALWKLNQGISYEFQTDDAEAYQKTVPNGAKVASIKSIGGKTIVWNQLNLNSGKSITKNGISFINNKDGSWTINGTCSASNDDGIDTIVYLFAKKYVSGHKYLVKADKYSDGNYGFAINGGSSPLKKAVIYNYAFNPIIFAKDKVTVDNVTIRMNIFDLTQMFGTGNEPSTQEEFEAMFPADYYPYNEGELMSMPVNEVVETGKNLLNPDDVVPITFYGLSYIKNQDGSFTMKGVSTVTAKNIQIRLFADLSRSRYDNVCVFYEGMFYKMVGKEENVTLQNSLSVTKYIFAFKNINLETGKEYEFTFYPMAYCGETEPAVYSPYRKNIFQIPQAILNLPGYGWSAGDVRNEVNWENKQYIQRVDKVDLGTLNWMESGDAQRDGNATYKSGSLNTVIRRYSTYSGNSICEKFNIVKVNDINRNEYEYSIGNSEMAYPLQFTVKSTFCTDENDFKNKINGIMLCYELAEPIVSDISDIIGNTFQEPLEVEVGGTLTFKNSNGNDYRIPVPSSEEYVISLAEVAK